MAITGLLLVFSLFRLRDFCYDHMMSQPLQICFLFIRSWSVLFTVFLGLQVYEAIAAIFWQSASYVFIFRVFSCFCCSVF